MSHTIVKTERDDVREKEEKIKLRINRIGRMVDNYIYIVCTPTPTIVGCL